MKKPLLILFLFLSYYGKTQSRSFKTTDETNRWNKQINTMRGQKKLWTLL
jgi:hypothetical protein